MARLRDFFESDLDLVINEDEFAEEVDIEGELVTVVLDSDALKEMQLSNGGEGLANSELLFHVKKSKLSFEPFPEQQILFNNKLYYVSDVKEDIGLYTVTLGVAGV